MQDEETPDGEATGGAADGVAQFQEAALDAVRAARAMLDAAESIVKDPAALESVVQTMTSFARSAGETVMGFAAGAAGEDADPSEEDDDEADGGFERIRVD